MLPHQAASYALNRAKAGHIAYDFAMDINDPSKLFCSEVVSDAYRSVGIDLWQTLSHISESGTRDLLASFGVENFTTQEPSDLEYDPQIAVVAEWRDYETLYQDRLDNAVVDIILEKANGGLRLEYKWYQLPVARLMKAYSWFMNLFDQAGPVPEGMDSPAALKNKWFSERHHAIREKLKKYADDFKEENGYAPPYWALVKLARKAELNLYGTNP